MLRVALLFTILILGMAFALMPDWDGVTIMTPDPFPFYDFGFGADGGRIGICWQTYTYMILELVAFTLLSLIIYKDTPTEYKGFGLLFLCLQVGNIIDYLGCYNSTWFIKYGISFSYNSFMVITFGIPLFARIGSTIYHRFYE